MLVSVTKTNFEINTPKTTITVGKSSMTCCCLYMVTVIVLLAPFSHSSRFRKTSYPHLRPAVQSEDDIELPTHNFVTGHDIAKS